MDSGPSSEAKAAAHAEAAEHPLLPLFRSASRERIIFAFIIVACLFGLIYAIRDVATPVLTAVGIAYVFAPVVDFLERRRVPRTLAVIALMIGVTVLAVGVIAVVVPTLVAQLSVLAAKLPDYFSRAITWIGLTFHVAVPTDTAEILDRLKAAVQDLGPGALGKAGTYMSRILAGTTGALSGIISLVLVPLFVFFFLKDWKTFKGKARVLLPAPMQPPIAAKLGQIDRSLSAYLRGVFTVATILAVIYSIALSALGVPLGLLIGVLAGYAYVVPFMSGVVGIGLGVLFSLLEFHGWGQVVGVLVIFIVGNMIEGLFLTPRIVGDSLGLPPIAVILAVMIGGNLFGFLGVLLALPTAAVLNVVGRDLLALWQSSNVYKTGLRGSS